MAEIGEVDQIALNDQPTLPSIISSGNSERLLGGFSMWPARNGGGRQRRRIQTYIRQVRRLVDLSCQKPGPKTRGHNDADVLKRAVKLVRFALEKKRKEMTVVVNTTAELNADSGGSVTETAATAGASSPTNSITTVTPIDAITHHKIHNSHRHLTATRHYRKRQMISSTLPSPRKASSATTTESSASTTLPPAGGRRSSGVSLSSAASSSGVSSSGTPSSSSATGGDAAKSIEENLEPPAAPNVSSSSLVRQYAGALVVSMPDGIVAECHPPPPGSVNDLSAILQPGDCLFRLLHGKGAQTLLLNAFCGHTKRRMFARLRWGADIAMAPIRACEFMCEFAADARNAAARVARIQVFCVNTSMISTTANASTSIGHNTFTTRHNASCALIYLDSASIPFLGHFPSEVTGRSLFSIVHADDVEAVKRAHQRLRDSGGAAIVGTPALRFLTYDNAVALRVNSEWAAFVNPWTRQIEMVVGRHEVVAACDPSTHTDSVPKSPVNAESSNSSIILDEQMAALPSAKTPPHIVGEASLSGADRAAAVRQHDAFVHDILSKPIELPMNKNDHKCNTVHHQQHQQQKLPMVEKQQCNNSNGKSISAYLERFVESLATSRNNVSQAVNNEFTPNEVINGTVQLATTDQSNGLSAAIWGLTELPYQQINYVENVNRLLMSQLLAAAASRRPASGSPELADVKPEADEPSPEPITEEDVEEFPPLQKMIKHELATAVEQSTSSLLTRELLALHDRKCEVEYRNNLSRRIKRCSAEIAQSDAPPAKWLRASTVANGGKTGAEARSQSPPSHPNPQQTPQKRLDGPVAILSLLIQQQKQQESNNNPGGGGNLNEYLLKMLLLAKQRQQQHQQQQECKNGQQQQPTTMLDKLNQLLLKQQQLQYEQHQQQQQSSQSPYNQLKMRLQN